MNFVSSSRGRSKSDARRTHAQQTRTWPAAGLLLALFNMVGGSFAQPTTAGVPPPTLPAIWPTLFALGAVLAAIVIFGWLMKKLNPGAANSGQLLRTISQISLGQKERVVVIEFQKQWLVLGVTAQSVQLLSTSTAPADGSIVPAPSKSMLSGAAPFSHWFNLARKPTPHAPHPPSASGSKTDPGQ